MKLHQAPLDARDFRRLIDGQLTERQWQKQVEEALDEHGWWKSHNPPNVLVCKYCRRRNFRSITKGIPDIWAMRPPYALYIELKTERGQLDRDQKRVRDLIRACGLTYLHARPRDRAVLLDWIANPELAKLA